MAKRRRQRIGKKGPRAVGKPKELMPLTAKGRTSRAVSTASSAATTATEDAYNNGSTSKTKVGLAEMATAKSDQYSRQKISDIFFVSLLFLSP